MSSPQRYPTNDELDYERRKAAGFPGLGVPGNDSKGQVTELQTLFATEGNETTAYVGVTQDRMTYSNDTEKPLMAQEGTEKDREERLIARKPLVAPAPPVPEGKQTEGGGSSTETVYTATSGEGFSSEIANPPETEKVPVEEAAPGQAGMADDSGQVEQGVGAGSSGQTVSDAVKEEHTVAATASPAPDQLSESVGEPTAPVDEPSTEQGESAAPKAPPTPTTRTSKKATDATSNAAESS